MSHETNISMAFFLSLFLPFLHTCAHRTTKLINNNLVLAKYWKIDHWPMKNVWMHLKINWKKPVSLLKKLTKNTMRCFHRLLDTKNEHSHFTYSFIGWLEYVESEICHFCNVEIKTTNYLNGDWKRFESLIVHMLHTLVIQNWKTLTLKQMTK